MSGGSIEQLLRLSLHVEASVLMGLVACDGGDALHKIENALGRATFLRQDRVDDLAGLGLREATAAQEVGTILVGARHDPLAGHLDAVDERQRRGVGEVRQRRRGLMGEAIGGVFGVADRDLLEVLDAPQIAVLANRAQIEARHPERLGADL